MNNCYTEQEDWHVLYSSISNRWSVVSGHQDFQSLYATNDMVTPAFSVNRTATFQHPSKIYVGLPKQINRKISAPIGACKCKFPPFWRFWQNDRSTNIRAHREFTLTKLSKGLDWEYTKVNIMYVQGVPLSLLNKLFVKGQTVKN